MAFQTSSRVLYTAHYNIIIYIYIGTRGEDMTTTIITTRYNANGARGSRYFAQVSIFYNISEEVSSPPPPGPGSCPTGRPANDKRREPAARSVNNVCYIIPQLRRVLKFMNILCCTSPPRRSHIRYNIIL